MKWGDARGGAERTGSGVLTPGDLVGEGRVRPARLEEQKGDEGGILQTLRWERVDGQNL